MVPVPKPLGERIEPRPYQQEAWVRLHQVRQAGERAALVHMATGLGKTTVAAGDIAQFLEERLRAGSPPPRILFMAHQRELLAQARDQLRRLLPDLNYSAFGGEHPHRRRRARVDFATLQSMARQMTGIPPEQYDYIVVDESHHGAAPNFSRVIQHFHPAFLLGITATPFRRDEADLTHLFGSLVFSLSLADAIAAGWLMSPDYRLYRDEVVNDVVEQDFTDVRALNHALFSEERNAKVADLIIEAEREFTAARTIVFARSIAHADVMTAHLPHARALHSGLPRHEQRDIIRQFRAGHRSTIVTVDMFNEGVDIPEANLIVFLRSTASRTIFEQQLGRGLRRSPGKDRVTVLDFIGTSERLYDLYRLKRAVAAAARRNPATGTAESVRTFDVHFTRQDLQIIERLKELQTVLPSPPPGYRTLTDVATDLGHPLSRVREACHQLGIPLILMRRKRGREGHYLSPEQIRTLEQDLPRRTPPSVGTLSIRQFSRTAGLGVSQTRTAMRELDITGTTQTAPRRGIAISLTIEEQQRIRDHITVAPDGWLSLAETARQLGKAPASVRSAATMLGIAGKRGHAATSRVPALLCSPDDVTRLRTHFYPGPVGENRSRQDIATRLGVSLAVVDRAIQKAGVSATQIARSPAGRAVQHFDTEAQHAIEEAIGIAPETWPRVDELAAALGVSQTTLRKHAARLHLTFRRFLVPGKTTREQRVSPEQEEVLRARISDSP